MYCFLSLAPMRELSQTEGAPRVQNKTKWNKFDVTFTNPFSNRDGEVVSFSVIVIPEKSLNHTSLSSTSEDLNINWGGSKNPPVPYTTIRQCQIFDESRNCGQPVTTGSRRKRAVPNPGDTVTVTVGADTECDPNQGGYCNGPLEPDTGYQILLRGYTEGGLFTDGYTSDVIMTGNISCPQRQTVVTASMSQWGAVLDTSQ